MEKSLRIITLLVLVFIFHRCDYMKTEEKKILIPEEIFICNGKEFKNFSKDTLRAEGIFIHKRESMAKNRARIDAQIQIAYLYQSFFSERNGENDHKNKVDPASEAERSLIRKNVNFNIGNLKIVCSETNYENGRYRVKVVAEASIHDISPPA
ncbi:MAG: hypothetical protein ACOCUQ_01045 [Bacteroidota bacterium]